MHSNRWGSDFDNWREGEYEAKKEEEEVYYPTKKDRWSKYKTKL